ncbi:MAG: hypothetical protein AAFR58_21030 [Cyanobacteria bacterium J06627_28]
MSNSIETGIETSFVCRVVNAFNTGLFRAWVGVAIVSAMLGPLYVVVYLLPGFSSWPQVTQQSLLLIGNLVHGLIVGALQWIVLRKHFCRTYWWIVATGLGYMASWLIYAVVSTPLLNALADPSVWGVADFFTGWLAHNLVNWTCFAVVVGGAQWLFFQRHLPGKMRLWIPAIFVAQILTPLVFMIPLPQLAEPAGILDFLNPRPTGISIVFGLARTVVVGFLYSLPTGLLLAAAVETRKSKS